MCRSRDFLDISSSGILVPSLYNLFPKFDFCNIQDGEDVDYNGDTKGLLIPIADPYTEEESSALHGFSSLPHCVSVDFVDSSRIS